MIILYVAEALPVHANEPDQTEHLILWYCVAQKKTFKNWNSTLRQNNWSED